jgi:hypothetical protein
VKTFLSTFGGIMSILITFTLYHKRWKVRHIIFNIQQKVKGIFANVNKTHHVWKYDVYVAYATLDRGWVHEVLLKTLENKYGFKVYIRFRDYIPGGNEIIQEIIDTMKVSRVHILILSENSVDKPWWRYEMMLALKCNEVANNSLIVIKLDDINNLLYDGEIIDMLGNCNVLTWQETFPSMGSEIDIDKVNLFWDKLVVTIYKFDPVNFKTALHHHRHKPDEEQSLVCGGNEASIFEIF